MTEGHADPDRLAAAKRAHAEAMAKLSAKRFGRAAPHSTTQPGLPGISTEEER